MTCKQLANKLNAINETNDIEVVKENGYYIIQMGGYERYESYNYQRSELK